MKIRPSDLAKFGTEAKQQTELKENAERQPKSVQVKTIEELIQKNAKDACKKFEGGKNFNHSR